MNQYCRYCANANIVGDDIFYCEPKNEVYLERWFLGDWCDALTYGNGELLLEMLKRGIEF